LLIRVMIFLLSIIMLKSCSPGWSVAGYELSPSDTTSNTVFVEIISSDSISHWYSDRINHGDNWCYRHGEWELVRIK